MRGMRPGSNGVNAASIAKKTAREESNKVMISVPYELTGFDVVAT